jgi:signal transduction histidine kinase
MPQGLPRKIRIAFIMQVVLVSLAVIVAGYLVSAVIRLGFVQNASQAEAEDFFRMRAGDPMYPVPNARTLDGWFVPAGVGTDGVPVEIAKLPTGYYELPDGNRLVRVDRRPQGTLFLVYHRNLIDQMLYGFAVLPIAVALLAVVAVSVLAYRASKRLVTPVNWLAREVVRWDPRHPDISMLAPENLPADLRVGSGEAQQLARALHALGRRVESFVARERDFTRDASHELRTPLTVIRVGSDLMMADPELTPRLHRSLQRIQRAGRDMEGVIDAFMILAREEGGGIHSEDFAVADVVHEEIENVQQLLADKPAVGLRVVETASPRLHAPPRVLGVMLGNLLNNACTFTDRGEIEVRVEQDRVSVRDTGIGMSAATLERAFDSFYRGSEEDPKRPGSMGLGLSIVRRLAERFGWQVRLESTPDTGTLATILFAR